MKWRAGEVAKITRGRVVAGDARRLARGVSTDSRALKPGQGFIALKGPNFDAHDFVATAVKKGAPWVMVNEGQGGRAALKSTAVIEVDDTLEALGRLAADCRRRFKVKVAAITGSVGKSTTKEMVAAMLGSKGRVLKNRGNLNNLVGLPLTLFRLNRSHHYAVLEMGCNAPGEILKLTKIARPDAGLITWVAPAHLEGLGSIQGVAKAKAELIRGLPSNATYVLNLDDPNIVLHARAFKGKIIGFSEKENARYRGEWLRLASMQKDVVAGKPMIRFSIRRMMNGKDKGRPVGFYLWTLSRHDALNALAACAMARTFGVSLLECAARLKGFKGLAGRGEVKRSRTGAFIMNDTYNASPAAVADALETVAWWSGPMRRVAVLGDMMELGKHAEKYHRSIGKKSAQYGFSGLVVKGDYAQVMARAAVEAGLDKSSVFVVKDNGQATRCLKKIVSKGDWVLVKGSRAMAMEEVARALMR